MNDNVKLIRQPITKNGRTYNNFFACWRYKNKFYSVRVLPRFKSDYDKLFGLCDFVEEGEDLEKYY